MPSPKKVELVEQLKKVIQKYPQFFVTEYKGMNVADITELRNKLRKSGSVYQIVKNNIFKIALKSQKISGLDEVLVGPNAILFFNDPVAAAKVLKEFIQDKIREEKLKIKAGYTEGQVVDENYVKAIADLPSKEELLSKLLGTLLNPMNRLVRVLNNPLQKTVIALKAIADQKQ